MLIHPWDAASPGEWRGWPGTTAPFGQLAVTSSDPGSAPIVIPTLKGWGVGHDTGAAVQQARRLTERGEWSGSTSPRE